MKGSNPPISGTKRKTRRSANKPKASERIMQNDDSDEFSNGDIIERRAARSKNQNKRK